MDPSSAQHHHHQEMSSNNNTLENMLVCSKAQQDPKKARPQPEQALKCPRCDSINTKFCYYNNYSLSQPRYFCKSCRRYWTKGGTLRNVPVGGGCRKNKRSSSSSSSSSSSAKRSQDHQPLITTSPLSHLTYDSNDLTLAFARLQKQHSGAQPQLGFDQSTDQHFSMMGMNNNLVAPAGNFYQNPNNFQNLYYGYGQGGVDEQVENGSASCGVEMVMPFGSEQMVSTSSGGGTGVTVTTLKQDHVVGNNSREGTTENRILWGFPWQLNGEVQSSNNMGDNVADSGTREMWNGLAPSWHGLLNSPLM